MKVLKTDSLKLYKDKLETYIPDLLETADESDITDLMEGIHKYKISIFPSMCSEYSNNYLCRLNIHRKSDKLELTDITSKSNIDCTAVYNNEYTLHFYTPTYLYFGLQYPNNGENFSSDYFHCLESVLEGEGQCAGKQDNPNTYYMELDISALDRIEFFPSWNAYGYGSEYFNARYSKAVTVKVECDGVEVFSDTISGLVKYDRVKIVFDKFNKVHLEKFNVGSASAFKDYY